MVYPVDKGITFHMQKEINYIVLQKFSQLYQVSSSCFLGDFPI
jgi:hypothetical protein